MTRARKFLQWVWQVILQDRQSSTAKDTLAVEVIKNRMLEMMREVDSPTRVDGTTEAISHATSAVDLWFLRPALMKHLASFESEQIAQKKINTLNELFAATQCGIVHRRLSNCGKLSIDARATHKPMHMKGVGEDK